MAALARAFCTIVAKNYLAYARTLAASLRRVHPGEPLCVLLVDEPDGLFDPSREPFEVLPLAALDLPRPREFCFRYELLELATAVKPYLLQTLFARGHERVVYLDPDIRLFSPLDGVFERLAQNDVVVTPHLARPPFAGMFPGEREILLTGAYNLGFLALRRSPAVDALLSWWATRCEHECLVRPDEGLFVDQRWFDLVPGFVDRVAILREPVYNVAYWNLPQRRIEGPPEAPRTEGQPVAFMHFSGFDADWPLRLSRHLGKSRKPANDEPLVSILEAYSRDLQAAGHATCRRWPYTWATFDDGHPIGPEMRELFRGQPPGRFPDPFRATGAGSFVSWAVTPNGDLASTPLLQRLRWAARPASSLLARLADRVRRVFQWPGASAPAQGLGPGAWAPLARHVLRRRLMPEGAPFPTEPGERQRLLQWLSEEGVRHHHLKPAWCAQWVALANAPPFPVMPRLLALYDARLELRRRFPMAFVEEHDAPGFLGWLELNAETLGLDAATHNGVRRVFAEQPGRRIAEIWRGRPDVQQAFPRAFARDDAAFLAWLRYSGRREYGVSEDWVLWFERAREQHVCRRVHALWEERPDWRERHPLAFSPLARKGFLAWLKQQDLDLAPALASLQRLCPPSPASALQELRQLHASDPELRGRFPQAFIGVPDTLALLQWLPSSATFDPDPLWLERLSAEIDALGLKNGVNVVGFLRAEFGLGEVARASVRALSAVDHPVAALNLDDVPHRQSDRSIRLEAEPERFPFTLVHMNPPELQRVRAKFEHLLRDRYVIGYWAWELERLPEDWREALVGVNEIWTCSRFSAAALAGACPVPVVPIWPALPEPAPSGLSRLELDLDPDEFVFLFVYDCHSQVARKNPLGLLEAFARAFRPEERVRLVLKTTNASAYPEDFARVRQRASGLRVTLRDGYLSRADLWALQRAADAYVSLHRAEGFGLTLVEAMALGKPVIATYYSGNTEFMSPWNSFPVPYRLVDIEQDSVSYRRGNVWAEPDIDAAAALMRAVVAQPEQARAVGARARADVERLLAPAACGRRMVERLAAISRQRLRLEWEADRPRLSIDR